MPKKIAIKKRPCPAFGSHEDSSGVFGSPEWIAAAILRKLTASSGRNAVATMSDYVALLKLRRVLCQPEIPATEYIWVDPDDFAEPSSPPKVR